MFLWLLFFFYLLVLLQNDVNLPVPRALLPTFTAPMMSRCSGLLRALSTAAPAFNFLYVCTSGGLSRISIALENRYIITVRLSPALYSSVMEAIGDSIVPFSYRWLCCLCASVVLTIFEYILITAAQYFELMLLLPHHHHWRPKQSFCRHVVDTRLWIFYVVLL